MSATQPHSKIENQKSKIENPYPGPRSFQQGETLYGRERETMELLDLLVAERVVLLYSPSGAGKTSLVQAALLPELEREGFRVLPLMRVNTEPPDGVTVNRYVWSVLLSLDEGRDKAEQLPVEELAGLTLAGYLERLPSDGATDGDVLVFDQFEEVLTIDPTDRAAKQEFFAQVGEALRERRRWALFAMREEFVAGLDPYLRPVPTRFANTFRLELLGEQAARQAMQEPARAVGVEFTDEAARKLVDDLRAVRVQEASGATAQTLGLTLEPVQLQVVCRRLWGGTALDDGRIDVDDLDDVGDVDDALRDYYAERVAAIAGETGTRERVIREWVDGQLITEQGIRGQVLQGAERSNGLDNRAIWPLVNAHLLRAEKRRGATWFELAHDRLIEPVRQDNAAWREAHLSALQRQAALWDRENRPTGLLFRDDALAEAERWAAAHEAQLEAHERDFLAASQEARRVRQRERRLFVGMGVVTVVAVVAAVIAFVFFRRAEKAQASARTASTESATEAAQARIARSQQLATQSQAAEDPTLSLLLAGAAVEATTQHGDPATVAARQSLLEALQRPLGLVLRGHEGGVSTVAWEGSGRYLASGSDDGTVRVWDMQQPEAEPLVLRGHEYGVSTVAWEGAGAIWRVAATMARCACGRCSSRRRSRSCCAGTSVGSVRWRGRGAGAIWRVAATMARCACGRCSSRRRSRSCCAGTRVGSVRWRGRGAGAIWRVAATMARCACGICSSRRRSRSCCAGTRVWVRTVAWDGSGR